MTKLHEITGQITHKETREVYNKKSPYHGNICYKLTITNDKHKENWIFIYPNLVNPTILKTIKNSRYIIDKRYLFFCEKKPKRRIVVR